MQKPIRCDAVVTKKAVKKTFFPLKKGTRSIEEPRARSESSVSRASSPAKPKGKQRSLIKIRRLKKQKSSRTAVTDKKSDQTASLALTPYHSEQAPVRSQLLTSATSRGRSTTFWADLNQTYFQGVDQSVAHTHINQLRIACRAQPHQQQASDLHAKINDHFSLYDYLQDVLVSGMQDLVDSTDPEEVALLRRVHVIDQHLQIEDRQDSAVQLLGHSLTPAQRNPNYSTEFFESSDANGNCASQSIDAHIDWLKKELMINQRQVSANNSQLLDKIQEHSKTECLSQSLLKNQCKILSKFFVKTVMHLEMLQLAESIQLVKAKREVSQDNLHLETPAFFKSLIQKAQASTGKQAVSEQYLISFDRSLNLKDVWVTPQQLYCFNQLRQEMASKQVKPRVVDDNVIEQETHQRTMAAQESLDSDSSDELEYIARSERTRGYDMDQLDFCHHCMQLKQTQIHVRCRYQSTKHRVNYPSSIHVNGLKIFNAEMHKPNLANTLILKKIISDKKRRHNLEESLEVTCGKQFCSFCLKNFYDTNFSTVKNDPNWCCPHCTGQCFCSRCRRQEQLTTAKGYLISLNTKDLIRSPQQAVNVLGQALPSIQQSEHPIDSWIKTNFELLVRTCDLSLKQKDQVPFFEQNVSTQQQIIQLTRKPVVQNYYEPVLRKRLRAEVNQYIQSLNVSTIQSQIDDQRLIKEIRQTTSQAISASTTSRST